MRLNLACQHCRSRDTQFSNFFDYPEFPFAGYGDVVEWSDTSDDLDILGTGRWQRSLLTPTQGEARLIKVRHPFSEELGSKFWAIYEPALSYFNGWENHPEDIAKSAFVECEFKEIIQHDPFEAWLKVEISDVILLDDCLTKIPEYTASPDFADSIMGFYPTAMLEFNHWHYYFGCAEGDLGAWGLIKLLDTRPHLVLYGVWDFHRSAVYLGNVILAEDSLSKLKHWYNNKQPIF